MAGKESGPVSKQELFAIKEMLKDAVSRIEHAVQVMIDAEISEVVLRSNPTKNDLLKRIDAFADDARSKTENASLSKRLGIQTKPQTSKDRYAAYGKKTKKAAKKGSVQ